MVILGDDLTNLLHHEHTLPNLHWELVSSFLLEVWITQTTNTIIPFTAFLLRGVRNQDDQ